MGSHHSIHYNLNNKHLYQLDKKLKNRSFSFSDLNITSVGKHFVRKGGNIDDFVLELKSLAGQFRVPKNNYRSCIDTWADDLFIRYDISSANKCKDLLHYIFLVFEKTSIYKQLGERFGIPQKDIINKIDDDTLMDWLQIWLRKNYPELTLFFFGQVLFKRLESFLAYEIDQMILYFPKFVIWNFASLLKNERNTKILLELAKGTNPRFIDPFRGIFTKKMAHYFYNAPKDYTIEQASWYAIAKGFNGNAKLAKTLRQYFRQWTTNMNILNKVIPFFAKQEERISKDEMHRLLGYLKHIQDEKGEIIINGWTLKSLRRRSDEWYEELNRQWHNNLLNHAQRQQIKKSWTGAKYRPFEITLNKRTYEIIQLTTAKELHIEGKKMRHCVGSYAYSCAHGDRSIWSLRYNDELENKRLVTIDVSQKHHIIQARGKLNRTPPNEHLTIIYLWADREGITY